MFVLYVPRLSLEAFRLNVTGMYRKALRIVIDLGSSDTREAQLDQPNRARVCLQIITLYRNGGLFPNEQYYFTKELCIFLGPD